MAMLNSIAICVLRRNLRNWTILYFCGTFDLYNFDTNQIVQGGILFEI